jgi:hypothetical protein
MGCGKESEPICVASILVTFCPLLQSIPGIGRDTKTGELDSNPVALPRWLLSFLLQFTASRQTHVRCKLPRPLGHSGQSWHRACGDIHGYILALRDETRHVLRRMRQAGSPARVGCLSRRGRLPIITNLMGACRGHIWQQ